jgi:hypothetical protein
LKNQQPISNHKRIIQIVEHHDDEAIALRPKTLHQAQQSKPAFLIQG